MRPRASVTRSRVASWNVDEPAVRRGVHVGLEVPVPGFTGAPERRRGVLQAVGRPAAVGEREWRGVVQIGVAYTVTVHRGIVAPFREPATTTVVPASGAGTAKTRRKSWESGPMARA